MISVVLPVFRNKDTLVELIDRIHQVLNKERLMHEIICVNDSCLDGSLVVLKHIVDHDPNCTVVDLVEHVGQHKAVLIGMAYAQGDWIVVMDADLQDPPEVLPQLLTIAKETQCVVFAGRKGRYEYSGRLFTSRVFKRILALLTRVPKDAGMFFVIPKNLKVKLLELRGVTPYVVTMLGVVATRMISYPVERTRRSTGTSAYSSFQRAISGMKAVVCAFQCRSPQFKNGSALPGHERLVRSVIRKNTGSLSCMENDEIIR